MSNDAFSFSNTLLIVSLFNYTNKQLFVVKYRVISTIAYNGTISCILFSKLLIFIQFRLNKTLPQLEENGSHEREDSLGVSALTVMESTLEIATENPVRQSKKGTAAEEPDVEIEICTSREREQLMSQSLRLMSEV